MNIRDITGIDSISIWPLALGWWIVLILLILVFLFCISRYVKKRAFLRSWRKNGLVQISELENNLTPQNAHLSLMTLSELLRRIAIRKYSRSECASLSGEHWLTWLQEHDPAEFNWKSNGSLLISAPYSPNTSDYSNEDLETIKKLMFASKKWLH